MESGGRSVRCVVGGRRGAPKVVFVHGSPGSWRTFARFLEDPSLKDRAFLISVDRLGYGGSGAGRTEPSLAAQARAVSAVFDLDVASAPVILVGHSYGGPVVVKAAALGDPRVRGVVIVAGAVDPDLEKKKWYQYLADLPAVRLFLPARLDVCNREIEALKGELTSMLVDWPKVTARVTVIQGLEDDRVPAANADFIARKLARLSPEIIRVPGLDHFVPQRRPDLIRAAILADLDALAARAPRRSGVQAGRQLRGRKHRQPARAADAEIRSGAVR